VGQRPRRGQMLAAALPLAALTAPQPWLPGPMQDSTYYRGGADPAGIVCVSADFLH